MFYNQVKQDGFELLAFPCNQFFGQESGTNKEIREFVKRKFGSNFPLFEKIEVNGPKTHPVYRYLRTHSQLCNKETKLTKKIPWNFAKFLLNGKG